MNLVYVGIPFYNAEKYLDYAIRSVLNQTYTNWKMTLIDDGSTDSSLALARKYTSDTRVKVISDGRNKGLVYRLNELVKLSDCKYFVRMDADDIMHPQRLENNLDIWKSIHRQMLLVAGHIRLILEIELLAF